MTISTVFKVNLFSGENDNFQVAAQGQEACNAIRKQFPKRKILLLGFQINDKFIPANLN